MKTGRYRNLVTLLSGISLLAAIIWIAFPPKKQGRTAQVVLEHALHSIERGRSAAIDVDHSENPTRIVAPPQNIRAEVSESRLQFMVVDSEGKAIGNAAVFLARGSPPVRALPAGSVRVGVTDDSGSLAVRADASAKEAGTAVACHVESDGFVSAWLQEVSEQVTNVVRLHKAVAVDLHCKTAAGAPIEGVRLQMSQTQVAWGAETPGKDVRPCGPPALQVFGGTTDKYGTCRLSGLTEGTYVVSIQHPYMVLRSRLPGGDSINISKDCSLDLVFEEPLVAAYCFREEPILYWHRQPQTLRNPHPTLSFSEGIIRQLLAEAERLGAGTRTTRYSIALASTARVSNPSLAVFAFLPGRGWSVTEVPYVTASRAHPIMLDTQPVFQCTEGQVSISVGREDGSQSRVPEVEGVVTALDDIPKLAGFALQLPILMSVSNGADVALPSGRYEFQQSRLALGHQFPATTCQVSAGGHIKVALVESLEYQPVRLTVTSTEGARIAFFTVNLRANNRSESVSWARSEGAPICYLATGQYKGEIYVQGFDKCEFDMLVGDGRGECEQAFVVSREAR